MARAVIPLAQNLLTYSEDFSQATWGAAPAFSVTLNDIANPVDGLVTASKITSATGLSVLWRNYVTTSTLPHTYTIYVKNGTRAGAGWDAGFVIYNASTAVSLITTASVAVGSGSTLFGSYTITDAGNSWLRIEMTVTSGWLPGHTFRLYWGASSVATVGEYWWVWGASLVRSNWSGPYVATGAAAVDNGNIRRKAPARTTSSARRAVIEMPYALTVNGTNGYSDHGNVYAKARTDAWSVSGWVKLTDSSLFRFIACKRSNSAPFTGWSFGTSVGGGLAFQLVANSAANHLYGQTATGTLKLNEWMHVVVTYAGTSLVSGVKFYVNSVAVTASVVADTIGTADIVATDPLRFGAQSAGTAAVWAGGLTRMRIHSRVLTPSEVIELYNNEVDAAPDGAALMTDGSGTTLTGTGTMPNGTITTPVWTTSTPMHARTVVP